jgi:hypothetical protein
MGNPEGRYVVILGKGELGLMFTSPGTDRLVVHRSDVTHSLTVMGHMGQEDTTADSIRVFLHPADKDLIALGSQEVRPSWIVLRVSHHNGFLKRKDRLKRRIISPTSTTARQNK